jgi:hypothetical protein
MPDVKSLRDQLLASGKAFAKGGTVTARMSGGGPAMQFLTVGGATSAGRQIIEARRNAEEKRMRDAMVEKDARDRFDRLPPGEINLAQLEKLCRCTVGNAFEQLPSPVEGVTAFEISRRTGLILQMLFKLNSLIDMRHDVRLFDSESKLQDLQGLFRDRIRYNAIRYDRDSRGEDVVKNVFSRLGELIEDLRSLERAIRETLTHYDPMAEWMEDYRRFEPVLEAAFDAYTVLEARAEERIYETEPA